MEIFYFVTVKMLKIKNVIQNTKISSIKLIILIAVFWMAFANLSFFKALLNDYPATIENIGFLSALTVGFTGAIIIALCLLCNRYSLKLLIIICLIISSLIAYFMDSYNTMIDDAMIKNAFETDQKEMLGLASPTMFLYFLLLGLLPSIFVYLAKIQYQPLKQEIIARAKTIFAVLIIVGISFFIYSPNATSFFREHKTTLYYSNPGNYAIGLVRYIRDILKEKDRKLSLIGKDAKKPESDTQRELIIMVVGETARADRFSLNGYDQKTNPLLEKQNVVSFSNVESCGTLTAISVPCMFAIDQEDSFDSNKAKHKENALDILKRSGAKVLWRDNNSSSKHVADRVIYQDYQSADTNTICDTECRDEGMLVGLQEYINQQKNGDILIILHQMGNHGPAYYKRYPKEFERFTPACHTNELSDCTEDEINNAYDNAILYTDYFLSKVIELLKQNDNRFETAMLYVSDHGESLGENGLYLHGIPNFIAPQTQRHVPVIMWIGSAFDEISFDELKAKKDIPLTHDNIFHTLLGLMEIDSKVYKKDMDFIKN
ncbi:phosphoethanolamine--lipid A transferase [Rickettsiales bacterium]|nr:phosphoethanolamine--lipid A transferase [Rickettsiales bacterium]